ncbi:MAG: peptide chain release factor 2 [Oscillospiraceae bacterium]|nr:peptide chain release factor 2 [Oscillospiraceae bacterium]
MIQFEEILLRLEGLRPRLTELREALALEDAAREIESLDKKSGEAGFWDDMQESQRVLRRLSSLRNRASSFENLTGKLDEALTLAEMGDEEDDISLLDEVKALADDFESELETQILATLLTGEYDSRNAILTFHAGAGGTEAQDWVEMLFRMYNKWSDRHKFKATTLDFLDGDEAGLKSVSMMVEGANAFGFLRCEAGVHRLVRISPFDSSGRRHTSFASLEVMPEISDEVEIDIRPDDLRVDTYRSSGAGGQHVNTTDSAVRITHIPTGVVAACQSERSQFQNRDTAMKMLKSKLIEIKEREHLERIEDIKGEQKDIAWGSQIRSYVFMPYTMVKDHRTGYEAGNISAVMDGDLDGFINAYLKAQSIGKLGAYD